MSEAKFTKGEWHWVHGDNDEHWDGVSLEIREPSLCTVDEFKTDYNYSLPKFIINHAEGMECLDEESRANAHLIAAAPEMYVMLETLVKENHIDQPVVDDVVLELLAKARGE